MKTFCHRCGEQKPTVLYAEIRECCVCGAMWEDHEKPETTALRNKIERMIADNALHCEQYNAGVDAAKAGKVCAPRPEFDTSTYYDGYAATMLPVLRERIAELEAALVTYIELEEAVVAFVSHLRCGHNEKAHLQMLVIEAIIEARALKGGE